MYQVSSPVSAQSVSRYVYAVAYPVSMRAIPHNPLDAGARKVRTETPALRVEVRAPSALSSSKLERSLREG